MEDCIFCKIAAGEIPSDKVYEDDKVLAFRDVSPQAPVHVLVIPKKHTQSMLTLDEEDLKTVQHIFSVIPGIAKDLGLSENGFRTVINTGRDGQQTVKHLHFHILGGRGLQWPPG